MAGLVALTATAVAAGCDDTPVPLPQKVAATPTPPAGTGTPEAPAADGGVVLPAPPAQAKEPDRRGGKLRAGVEVRRSGGFVAHDDTLAVDADGRWTYTSNRRLEEGRLSAARARTLADLLAAPAFAVEAGRQYREACPDGLELTVTSGDHKVTWRDCGQEGRPRAATTVVDRLAAWTPL